MNIAAPQTPPPDQPAVASSNTTAPAVAANASGAASAVVQAVAGEGAGGYLPQAISLALSQIEPASGATAASVSTASPSHQIALQNFVQDLLSAVHSSSGSSSAPTAQTEKGRLVTGLQSLINQLGGSSGAAGTTLSPALAAVQTDYQNLIASNPGTNPTLQSFLQSILQNLPSSATPGSVVSAYA